MQQAGGGLGVGATAHLQLAFLGLQQPVDGAALMRCNFSRTVASTVISPNFSSSGNWCRSTPISRLPHMPPYSYQIFSSASYTCWS